MRLLEPFAGLRLLAGHPVFHLAFFVASFRVTGIHDDEEHNVYYHNVIYFRRAHCIVLILGLFEYWLKHDKRAKAAERKALVDEDEKKLDSIRNWREFYQLLCGLTQNVQFMLFTLACIHVQWFLSHETEYVIHGENISLNHLWQRIWL